MLHPVLHYRTPWPKHEHLNSVIYFKLKSNMEKKAEIWWPYMSMRERQQSDITEWPLHKGEMEHWRLISYKGACIYSFFFFNQLLVTGLFALRFLLVYNQQLTRNRQWCHDFPAVGLKHLSQMEPQLSNTNTTVEE